MTGRSARAGGETRGRSAVSFLVLLGAAVLLGQSALRTELCLRGMLERGAAGTATVGPGATAAGSKGSVDPVYRALLAEAERRSARDFAAAHTRGARGVMLGPTAGDFFRHTLPALRNARRIRRTLRDAEVRIALATSPRQLRILRERCREARPSRFFQEPCRLWANGTLFDDIVLTEDESQWSETRTSRIGTPTPSRFWLQSLGSYRHAPYRTTLVLDSDAFTCPGFEALFLLAEPRNQSVWQLGNQGTTDFAAGIDQYPFGNGALSFLRPGDVESLQDFDDFPERNTGTLLFHFHRRLAHTFAHFVPLVAEHIWHHKATEDGAIANDQAPFRVATYLFHRLRPEFVEQQIPQHASCRTYPGIRLAGTDAERSRMLPVLRNGSRCNDCRCSPCLVAHFGTRTPLPLDGRAGYEDDN